MDVDSDSGAPCHEPWLPVAGVGPRAVAPPNELSGGHKKWTVPWMPKDSKFIDRPFGIYDPSSLVIFPKDETRFEDWDEAQVPARSGLDGHIRVTY